jgi:hypothetical protein
LISVPGASLSVGQAESEAPGEEINKSVSMDNLILPIGIQCSDKNEKLPRK